MSVPLRVRTALEARSAPVGIWPLGTGRTNKRRLIERAILYQSDVLPWFYLDTATIYQMLVVSDPTGAEDDWRDGDRDSDRARTEAGTED